MKKRKTIRIMLIVAALAVTGACLYGGIQLSAQSYMEKEKKETNRVAAITDVFHDQANEYITPDEPKITEDITLRIRTERYNVTKAQIQYTTDEGKSWKTADMEFEKHDDTGYYDFFKGVIPAQKETIYYRFICANDAEDSTVFVDRRLLPEKAEMGTYSDCFIVIPGFSTPDWAKGTLWYSLMPDAFYNGDTSNDVTISDNNSTNSWNNVHRGLTDKYGGDLAGVVAKTDYIKELGVDGVYMNPVFRSNQNAGYGQIDFTQIDSSFGNEETFREMCAALHDNGLRVMMDAVLTFTTTNSIYADYSKRYPLDGANESEDSPYRDIFAYYNWPNYYLSTWGGIALDHGKESTQKLLYSEEDSFLQHYSTAPYSVDGWRFDCGGYLWGTTETGNEYADVVMGRIREYLKNANPEVYLISESDSGNLKNGVWDGEWNLELIDAFNRYANGVSSETTFKAVLNKTVLQYPRPVALCMTNMRSQHDKQRIIDTAWENDKASVLVQLTFVGAPSIYYGEEIGLNRRNEFGVGLPASFYAMEWDETNWDYEKYNLYCALGELRQKYSAVKTGAIKELVCNSTDSIYAFGRWDDKGTVITIASQNTENVNVELNVRSLSVKDGTIFTDWFTGKQYKVDSEGKIIADVIPGGTILVEGKKASKKYSVEHASSNINKELNSDDFESKDGNRLFINSNDKKVSLKDGKLVLNAKKGLVSQTTYGKDNDWTFQAKLESSVSAGSYVGVLCTDGTGQFVAAGRTEVDGKKVLFFGRTTDGSVVIDHYVTDTDSDKPVIIQLQRIGTTYSAVYSYNGESFRSIGNSIFANYSNELVGVFAEKMKAEFDYACFGNSIIDGQSVNTPYAEGVIDLDYSTNITASKAEAMEIVSGNWEYYLEGYKQSDTEGVAKLGVNNKQYEDVRVNLTIELLEGKGYAGVGFGKKNYDSDPENGFLLKYTPEQKLVLMKNGKKMADATVATEDGGALRIVLETEGETIRVYAGQDSKLVFSLSNTGYVRGYINFCTANASARFMNYRISSLEAEWFQLSGTDTVFGGANVITCSGKTNASSESYGGITRLGVGVTDFAAIAQISIGARKNADGTPAEGGILFCASEGKSKNIDGVSISVMEGGILSLKSNGKEVANYSLGEDVKKVQIMFVKKDQQCSVWVEGIQEPVITWKDELERGGVYQLYAVNTTARFARLQLEDIHDVDVKKSNLVQIWNNGQVPIPKAADFVADFENQDALQSLLQLNLWHGDWAIQDGVLSCTKAQGSVASMVIHDRIYSDFDMSFKYRYDEADSAGWAHVIFRKPTVNSAHYGTNYSVLMSVSGGIQLYNGTAIVAKGKIEGVELRKWVDMQIICKGNQISVYGNGNEILTYTDPGYGTTFATEGFISFDSNQTRYSIDDVKIRSLK